MKTIRQSLEGRGNEIIRHFIGMMAEGGIDASLEGTVLLAGSSKDTVLGALILHTGKLYLADRTAAPEAAEKTLAALHTFISWQRDIGCHTWGKRSILEILNTMKRADALDVLSEEELTMLEEKTRVDDFFDKKELKLIGMANNYVDLALNLLEMRRRLGWETEEICAAVRSMWEKSLDGGTDSGYMDDAPPHGRFDSYTFMPVMSAPGRAKNAGRDLTDLEKQHLRETADWFLAMANARGDGFCYGRSLSMYGDIESISILSCAMDLGLLNEEQTKIAVSYMAATFEKKFFGFWYDEGRGSFNMWWDGRGTDNYREAHRALEVNLEYGNTLNSKLNFFESKGYADFAPIALPCPAEWQVSPFTFRKTPYLACAFVLRRGDLLMMLPFIGKGPLNRYAQYSPFPASCRFTEVSAQSKMPSFVPEYKMANGDLLTPEQFYDDVTWQKDGDTLSFVATGHLALTNPNYKPASVTDYTFTHKILIVGNTVKASFETNAPFESVRMWTVENTYGTKAMATGFAESAPAAATAEDTRGPHGPLTITEHRATTGDVFGYELTIPDEAFRA